MKDTPILMTYDFWINSQFSIVKFTGGLKINGEYYCLAFEQKNKDTPDLLRYDWMKVYKKLGREKTIKLINNGTTIDVAKGMIKAMKERENLPKLF